MEGMLGETISEAADGSKSPREVGKKQLRFLGFLPTVIAYAATAYEVAKEKSGPLKGGVGKAEDAVKSLTSPILDRLPLTPLDLVEHLDEKVGDVFDKLELHILGRLKGHVPPLVWDAISLTYTVLEMVLTLARDVRRLGVLEAAKIPAKDAVAWSENKAKELYDRYEPAAERLAAARWRRLNAIPMFPSVARITVPTAAYFVETYNAVVAYGRAKGYVVSRYVPVVPLERIAKVFAEGGRDK